MARGRKPDPAYIREQKQRNKLKRGELPRGERLEFPVINGVVMPDVLVRQGAICWMRMAEILHAAKLFTQVTSEKLTRYCQAWQDFDDITRMRNGLGVRQWAIGFRNEKSAAYQQRRIEQAEKVMADFEREYGLTPASAAKIRDPRKMKDVSPATDLADFVGAKPKLTQ